MKKPVSSLFKRNASLIIIFLLAVHTLARTSFRVGNLTCQEMENPLCVNNVRLGWQLISDAPNVYQSAYTIQVFCDKKPVFETGRVESDAQSDVTLPFTFQQGKSYTWKVRVWDANGKPSAWSKPATFGMAINDAWQAKWIATGQPGDAPLPYIRKEVHLQRSSVRRAVVYLCGLGCSQLYFNGQAVDSTRVLDPAQTDYDKRALYSAFDVTQMLSKDGRNCLGVMMGKGWYTQDAVWIPGGFSYGNPILRCQMNIEYKDGRQEVIGTDESWRWTEGPIQRTNIYQGEEYDARKSITGWSSSGFDDTDWKPCLLAEGVIPQRMEVQEIPPMRQLGEVNPVRMWKSPQADNCWIYDFGVNRTANVKFHVNLPSGTRLVTRGSETMYDDGSLDYRSAGPQFVGYQEDAYICSGNGMETWSPTFTYHGFQYIELQVEGTDAIPDTTWLSVVPVHTDVRQRGTFECSDEQLEGLHRIATQTFLNGFVGLPVDCNQREKCGWLGDTHAYDRAANMNFQMNNFWMKYLDDIRTTSDVFLPNTLHQKLYNTQFYYADKQPGIPFMIAPGKRLCGVASPDWGTAVVQLPWHLYLYYGNRGILERYYDMMNLWVHHIDSIAVEDIVYYGLGDWCPPYSGRFHNVTKVEFSSTAFHLLDLSIMQRVAHLLGKETEAAWFQKRVESTRLAMQERFYNPEKHSFGSQTADAMALELGLAPEGMERLVAEDFILDVQNNPLHFLGMGIFGLSRFGEQLCRQGMSSDVFALFTKKGPNSWGVMLDSLHVTTLWEEIPLDATHAKDIVSSHCHPMQGGYDIWFYEDVLGIRPVEEAPGFRQILFRPTVTNEMEWARGTLETAYGTVASNWHHEGESLHWDIAIPPCSRGQVFFPNVSENQRILVNGKPLSSDIPTLESTDGLLYLFPSGKYTFIITK